jgi:hypothetical protein
MGGRAATVLCHGRQALPWMRSGAALYSIPDAPCGVAGVYRLRTPIQDAKRIAVASLMTGMLVLAADLEGVGAMVSHIEVAQIGQDHGRRVGRVSQR